MKQGWEIKRLEDAVEFQRGLTYSKKDEVDFSDNIVLRSNNVDLIKNELDFTELKYINPAIEVQESKKVKKGSLLICTANGSKSHLGKVALIDDNYNYAFGGFMGQVTPKEKLDSKFLFYLMTSDNYKKFINELSDGANINNLKFSDLGQFEIPLPPLPEQQRIVSILDEAFAAIAKAKANAEQNLKNAKELFESYLQGVFENGNYQTLEFGEVCELVGGSQPSKEHFIYEPKDGYIRLIQVRDYRTDKFITYIPKSLAKRFCDKEDIMIGRYGPPIFGIFKGLEGAYNVALMKAVVNEKLCDRTYFYWFLQNNKIREFVEQSSKRAVGQDGVRKELLEKYPVPVPSLKEQQTIVRQLDALRAEMQKLEAVYQKKLDDLEELKKSILQKAFAGELKTEKAVAI